MSIREVNSEAKRSRGRPRVRSDDETRHVVAEAAAREFHANGYAGTSMSSVAQSAGVSTKTMYRLFPAKADLFSAAVAAGIGKFMLAIDDRALSRDELQGALERMLVAYGMLALNEETIALNRLVVGECDRFPEIAGAFYDFAVLRTSLAMEMWLRRQAENGLIAIDDSMMAVGLLRGMMIMEPQRAVMLGRRPAPTAEEIVDRARACAQLFLRGCAI